MEIKNFVKGYKNHPILFVGTGFSLRYLNNSFTWDGLLKKVAEDYASKEKYYDIKSECLRNPHVVNDYNFEKIGSLLEKDFNNFLKENKPIEFDAIIKRFYDEIEKNSNIISMFKIYISELLKELDYKNEIHHEVEELKKAKKNISSIITTNYDKLVEDILDFKPIIGNDILLTNPYGTLYKIHGCVDEPEKIIISEEDYKNFDRKYELIKAQLISLFINNPIIFYRL